MTPFALAADISLLLGTEASLCKAFALLYRIREIARVNSMRVKTIQIVWHEKKPIYSVDFHTSGMLATGGGDNDIKVRRECKNSDLCHINCCYLCPCLVLQLWEVSGSNDLHTVQSALQTFRSLNYA